MSKIRIESGGLGINTHVFVDGVALTSVAYLSFEVDASGMAVATLKAYVDEISVDGEARIRQEVVARPEPWTIGGPS